MTDLYGGTMRSPDDCSSALCYCALWRHGSEFRRTCPGRIGADGVEAHCRPMLWADLDFDDAYNGSRYNDAHLDEVCSKCHETVEFCRCWGYTNDEVDRWDGQ